MGERAPPDVHIGQDIWVWCDQSERWQSAPVTKITTYAEKQNGFQVQIDSRLLKFKKNEYGTKWREIESLYNWDQFVIQAQQAEKLITDGLSEEDVKSQVRKMMLQEFGEDGPDLADANVVNELPTKRQKMEEDVRRDGVESLRDAYTTMMGAVDSLQRALTDHIDRHHSVSLATPEDGEDRE